METARVVNIVASDMGFFFSEEKIPVFVIQENQNISFTIHLCD